MSFFKLSHVSTFMAGRYNTRLIHLRRSYSPQQVAELLGVNTKTCRRWIKEGLTPLAGGTRPVLIMGSELKRFLLEKRANRKTQLKDGECYCLKCRIGVKPKKGTQKKIKTGKLIGKNNREQYKLVGLCERCDGEVCRFL